MCYIPHNTLAIRFTYCLYRYAESGLVMILIKRNE